jgi:hypothetical protein
MTVAATTAPPRRTMECERCGAEWSVPKLPLPGTAVHCPYCEAHICGCGCGEDLRDQRRDSIYRAESHWRRLQRATSSDRPPTKTVADARVLHEDAKAHWSMVVDEAILRHFKADPAGIFHADDLESLGIPDDHRNVIGSQIAKWVNRKRMVECGRRGASVPSRNGAKSNEYRLTERGRDLVAGLDTRNPEGTAGSHRLPAPSTGRASGSTGASSGAGSSTSVESGEPGRPPAGVVGAGQEQGKSGRGRVESSSVAAGTDAPDHHHGVLPASSPYSPENEYA